MKVPFLRLEERKTTAAALVLALGGLVLIPAAGEAGKKETPEAAKSVSLAWADLDGRGYSPLFLRSQSATVFLFFSTECPLANAYVPRIKALEADYYRRGVRLFLVDAHPADTEERLRDYLKTRELSIPVVRDPAGVL